MFVLLTIRAIIYAYTIIMCTKKRTSIWKSASVVFKNVRVLIPTWVTNLELAY